MRILMARLVEIIAYRRLDDKFDIRNSVKASQIYMSEVKSKGLNLLLDIWSASQSLESVHKFQEHVVSYL